MSALSGTNPIEAKKAGCAFLSYLSKYNNVHFILTTHYASMCKKIKKENTDFKKKTENKYKKN